MISSVSINRFIIVATDVLYLVHMSSYEVLFVVLL